MVDVVIGDASYRIFLTRALFVLAPMIIDAFRL